jgi:mRNA-degrading endonuclease RelE of RelBE toxin-antitoxin system
MYKIRFKRQAVKEFALLPENIRNIIEEKLILLSI